MPRLGRRLAPLAALASAACDGGFTPAQPEWASGNGPDFCQAGPAEGSAGGLWITLRRPAAASVVTVRDSAFARLAPETPQPDFVLAIDGAPVRAAALASERRNGPGLDFHFNPRPVLRRHPGGFEAVVTRAGQEVYRTRVEGPAAATAIGEALACDRQLLIRGRIDPFQE